MNKMVINHLEKLFVTNDAATIIRHLEVEHPAAKLLILGSQMQENEIGDATNFVIIFAGALLRVAEDLLRMGLKPTEVADGYEIALNKALELLPSLSCYQVINSMVFKRHAESNIIKKESCKIAIYTCPIDALQTETKGTVLIKTAEELTTFSRGEESQLEKQIKAIA